MIRSLSVSWLFVTLNSICLGQVGHPGKPLSHLALSPVNLAQSSWALAKPQEVPIVELPSPNISALIQEDSLDLRMAKPLRVAQNIAANLSSSSSGLWEQVTSNTWLWRARISVNDAWALNLYFDNVEIPAGGNLHFYSSDGSYVLGAYTSETPKFYASQIIPGDQFTIEYSGPKDGFVLELSKVGYFYKTLSGESSRANECQVDVACPEGDEWQDQINSTLHYTFTDDLFTYVCSANLINNTNEDCRPFVLTAAHCGEFTSTSQLNTSVWYFNYQRPTCQPGNSVVYPTPNSTLTGAIFRMSTTLGTHDPTENQVPGADIALYELNQDIPESFNAYLAGWNRQNSSTVANQGGVSVHHPAGHEKKISTYTQAPFTTSFNQGLAGAHWAITWVETENGWGHSEGGSSGSALFDSNGLIMGPLSGSINVDDCTFLEDDPLSLFGKLIACWTTNGTGPSSLLNTWLDPLQTGQTSLAGQPYCTNSGPDEYCDASGTLCMNFITDVIGNQGAFDSGCDGYTNFLSSINISEPGSTVNLTIYTQLEEDPAAFGYIGDQLGVYVDFNENGVYDTSELLDIVTYSNTSTFPAQLSFQIPSSQEPGLYNLRIRYMNENEAEFTPCGDFMFGEVEDYFLEVTEGSPSSYCTPVIDVCDEYIQSISTSTFTQSSDCDFASYTDEVISVINPGNFFEAALTIYIGDEMSVYINDQVHVWVDWNNNGSFSSSELEYYELITNGNQNPVDVNFFVPGGTSPGDYRIRFRLSYNPEVGENVGPCSPSEYGEVEDYLLRVEESNSTGVLTVLPPNDYAYTCGFDPDPSFTGSPQAATTCPNTNITTSYEDSFLSAPTCSGEPDIVRTWTVSDQCGNVWEHEQFIESGDNASPTMNCTLLPDVYDVELLGNTMVDFSTFIDIGDNCTAIDEIQIEQFPQPNSIINPGMGSISLTIALTDNCGNTSTCEKSMAIIYPVSTSSPSALPLVEMYPNPANDKLWLESHAGEISSLIIYNLEGRLVLNTAKLSSVNEIDISHLAKGIYTVELNVNDKMVREKLIIQ